ncbi:hypothetical protein BIV04_11490 [Frigoribacterium sp. MCBA15_019]|nr:hypothetical protein BIV04_11490 [Frigoribacterium sp. MCBA15_019]
MTQAVSRYELQWVVVINSVVIALFAGVYALDVDGSVFLGLLVIAAMLGQISSATRPERPEKVAQREADEAPRGS